MRTPRKSLLVAGMLLFGALAPASAHAAPLDVTITAADAADDANTMVSDHVNAYNYGNVQFTFTGEDAAHYECQIEKDGVPIPGAEWNALCDDPDPMARQFSPVADGSYAFKVRASTADAPTDWGPVASFNWVADFTAPVATAAIPALAGDPTKQTDFTIELAATNPADASDESLNVWWHYKYDDDASWFPGSMFGNNILTRNGLSDGAKAITVKAVDRAGNESNEHRLDWTVDTTPPVLGDIVRTGGYGSEQSMAFSSDDPAATYECKLSDATATLADWQACATPLDLHMLADGDYTFEVRATDAATNVSPAGSARFTVDTTAPNVTLAPTSPWRAVDDRRSSHTFALGADEAATYECKLDAAGWAPCTTPHTLSGLTDGAHTLAVRATDIAGHKSAPLSVDWTTALLKTSPDGPAIGRPDGSATVKWTGNASTYACSVNGGAWSACVSPLELTALSDGAQQVRVKGSDDGVDADVISIAFVINRAVQLPPATDQDPGTNTGTGTGPAPTTADPVRIGVTTAGRSKTARFDAKGRLKLRSTCTAEAGCIATRAKWTLTVGKKRFSGSFVMKKRAAGKPATVTLKLTSKARKALAQSKRGGRLVVQSGTSRLTLNASSAKTKGKKGKKSKKSKKSGSKRQSS